jgi:class 3 adenylate cyclase
MLKRLLPQDLMLLDPGKWFLSLIQFPELESLMLESERRLAAIMFTDIDGYTAFAQEN